MATFNCRDAPTAAQSQSKDRPEQHGRFVGNDFVGHRGDRSPRGIAEGDVRDGEQAFGELVTPGLRVLYGCRHLFQDGLEVGRDAGGLRDDVRLEIAVNQRRFLPVEVGDLRLSRGGPDGVRRGGI